MISYNKTNINYIINKIIISLQSVFLLFLLY